MLKTTLSKPLTIKVMPRSLNELSFFGHLGELRDRLIKSLVAVGVGCCIAYQFIDPALAFLIKPVGHLVFTAPSEAFNARMTLTFVGGIFLSSPYVVYHIWEFVALALREEERKYIALYGPLSLIFFLSGVIFAYFVAIPYSIQFLLSFSSNLLVPMITVNNYISYVGTLLLGFGVVFELPLILMFLTKIGIATPAFLIHYRRHAIILILIVSAILTPPDVISQIIMAAPLLILYEIGIFISKLTFKDLNTQLKKANS